MVKQEQLILIDNVVNEGEDSARYPSSPLPYGWQLWSISLWKLYNYKHLDEGIIKYLILFKRKIVV